LERNSKMKTIKSIIAAGAITLSSLVGNAQNGLIYQKPQNGFDSRAKVEYSGNLDEKFQVRSTFGIASQGGFDKPIPLAGQFSEIFRVWDVYSKNNGQENHYTAAGIRVPSFETGNVETRILAFGSVDDLTGMGIEGEHVLGKFTFTWNAEGESKNDANRLGMGLQYQILPNLSIDAGFDSVQKNGLSEDRINGRVMYDIGRHNLGFGVLKIENENPNTRIGGFYILKGDAKKVGARVVGDMAFYDNGDKNGFAQLILAQNPTSGKLGALTFFDRRASQAGGYNASVVPLSISNFEPIRYSDRTTSGLAFILDSTYYENDDVSSWSINPNIAYNFKQPILGGNLGVYCGASYSFDGAKDEGISALTGGLIYRLGNKLELDTGFSMPIDNEDAKPSLRVGVQYVF
jgi:hypothetical protein